MAALGETLGRVEGRTTDLVVGSIKNSIGHLEAAAGVASVIKAALTLHHRQLAPAGEPEPTEPGDPVRRAPAAGDHRGRTVPGRLPTAAVSVNGFGYGGTNAHAILVEAPKPTPPVARRAPAQVLPVSGRNAEGARQLAQGVAAARRRPSGGPGCAGGHHVVATGAPQLPVRRAVRRPR